MPRFVAAADLKGLTMTNVEQREDDELWFYSSDGRVFQMYHAQDCCESVYIESIVGDLSDLVGEPLLIAEEVTSREDDDPAPHDGYSDDYHTWTFYKFATRKGYVDIRWYGTSNGYYSESVDIKEVRIQ